MKRFELDNYKEEIIKLYIDEKLSCEIISQKLNASLCGIYDALRRWGVKTRNLSDSHRQYNIDENYFDTINTEEKAYWLGFIYADGFITNPHSFGIALAIIDKGHLYKLLKSLNSNYPLHDYRTNNSYGRNQYSRFLVKNKNIYNQLQSKGVKLVKSLIIEFPDETILPKDLYRHFIRGYFDDDGSLILSKNSINFKICGTYEFLTKLIDIFNEVSNYSYQYKLFKRRKDDKNNYYLSYGGKYKVYSIMSYLYEDCSIFLDRKKLKYLMLKDLNSN